MYLKKIIVFLIFCLVASFFFACSEDWLVTVSSAKEVRINKNLAKVTGLAIETRYRDSVFIGTVGAWSASNQKFLAEGTPEKIKFSKFKNPELKDGSDNYIEHMENYLNEFMLQWNSVDNAYGYELRASLKPITEENWQIAEKVDLRSADEVDGLIKAVARLTPTPKMYTSNCVNCEECYVACPTGAIYMEKNKAVVDYEKCIECGECFRACNYDAIGGVFAGTEYYFAIRAFDEDSAYSEGITCTDSRYKVKYVSLANLPDSLNQKDSKTGQYVKGAAGCAGNCTDGSGGDSRGFASQCFILQYNACPVDAVYEVAPENLEERNTVKGAMYIDEEKCINCGECATSCYSVGPKGAIVTEMVKVD